MRVSRVAAGTSIFARAVCLWRGHAFRYHDLQTTDGSWAFIGKCDHCGRLLIGVGP